MLPLLDNIFNYLPVFYPENDEDENNGNFYDDKFYDQYDYEDFIRQEEIELYEYGERLRNNKLRPYERLQLEQAHERKHNTEKNQQKFNWELFEKIRYEEMLTLKDQFILL